jgi:hypothetical protein
VSADGCWNCALCSKDFFDYKCGKTKINTTNDVKEKRFNQHCPMVANKDGA